MLACCVELEMGFESLVRDLRLYEMTVAAMGSCMGLATAILGVCAETARSKVLSRGLSKCIQRHRCEK